jgi:hypothetical protein
MPKQLYIIQYNSAHWCGGESHCVVWAYNADEAVLEASDFMEDNMRELFSSEYDDEFDEENEAGAYDDEQAYTVDWCELLTPEHEHWEYYVNLTQADFYPEIGSPL